MYSGHYCGSLAVSRKWRTTKSCKLLIMFDGERILRRRVGLWTRRTHCHKYKIVPMNYNPFWFVTCIYIYTFN